MNMNPSQFIFNELPSLHDLDPLNY